MFSVALVGPDGSGKSTIGQRLEDELSIPAKYVYMSVNLETSSRLLPTTRLIVEAKRLMGKRPVLSGPPDPSQLKKRSPVKRLSTEVKTAARFAFQIPEEWFQQAVVWYYKRRGAVVLCDRHYFVDYYHYDVSNRVKGRSLAHRFHGWMLKHLYPRPDLVIFLNAPAEVLHERKPETPLEFLENRLQEYGQLGEAVDRFETVDATQPLDVVVDQVKNIILEAAGQMA